jgi:hypothetical protein
MDAAEYKKTTASPDVFGAADLQATVTCLRTCGSSLAQAIAEASRTPIPKPPLHRGGPDADFFRVELPLEVVTELVGELLDAEAAAVSPEGTTTPEASRRASLVDRWGRYQRWLEERRLTSG